MCCETGTKPVAVTVLGYNLKHLKKFLVFIPNPWLNCLELVNKPASVNLFLGHLQMSYLPNESFYIDRFLQPWIQFISDSRNKLLDCISLRRLKTLHAIWNNQWSEPHVIPTISLFPWQQSIGVVDNRSVSQTVFETRVVLLLIMLMNRCLKQRIGALASCSHCLTIVSWICPRIQFWRKTSRFTWLLLLPLWHWLSFCPGQSRFLPYFAWTSWKLWWITCLTCPRQT